MNEIVIETKQLRKQFGKVAAVDDVELQVHTNEVFGFLGPNGAGKTTTIGMLLGLVLPTSGEIRMLGSPVTPSRLVPLRRVGSLIGAPSFAPHLSGRNNLKMIGRLYPHVNGKRIDEVLELVALTYAAKRKAKGYSTGMKQRLGLAAALLHDPELIILDEPTSGLDPNGVREFRHIIHNLVEMGKTVFLSSHQLHEVQQVCNRVAILNKGRVVAQGRVDTLLAPQKAIRVRVPDEEMETAASIIAAVLRQSPQRHGNYLNIVGMELQEIIRVLTVEHGIIPTEIKAAENGLETLFAQLTQEAN